MMKTFLSLVCLCSLAACSTTDERNPSNDAIKRELPVVIDDVDLDRAGFELQSQEAADRGKYMVELLGCGSCHTDGAIAGRANPTDLLSGSDIGIAFTTPLQYRDPGVVYVPNITPDDETGIGAWSAEQIVNAIRAGKNLHGIREGQVMPWEGYSILTDEDAYAIAAYLQNIPAVRHRVPENVPEGEQATNPYIYLGVYEQN